jgi:RNA polymerase sigma-70 factor (ECF subfamily)
MSETMILDINQRSGLDEDAKLVVAAQQNPAEFRQLYVKWLKPVYRYIFFRVNSVKDAEDLTSQVFLKAYSDLPRYRSQKAFSAWLFTIAHARVVDFYRKGNHEVSIEEIEVPETVSDPLMSLVQSDEIQQMLKMIRGLPEDDQELIRLRFAAELNYREIGLVVNRSEDAVRKSLSRLLTRIQTQMEVN